MPVGAPVVASDPAALAAVVEVGFAGADGARRRERLASCWDVRFEVAPVRSFRWATAIVRQAFGPVERAMFRVLGIRQYLLLRRAAS